MRIAPRALLAACLAGCGGAHADTTLTVAAYPAVDRIIAAAIPAWNKLHPDVHIKLVSREFSDHHLAMTVCQASTSCQTDVMAIERAHLGRFAEGGALEDLFKPPYAAARYRERFAAYTYPLATNSAGQLVAVPADIGPGTLFYRADLLRRAGLSEAALTASWESYIEAGKTIKARTGAFLLAHAREMKDIVIRADVADGEGVFFDRHGAPLVDNARFVKAFTLARAVRAARLDAGINSWSNEWTESLRRGSIATQMMGSWLGAHLANTFAPDGAGLWRAAPLPNQVFAAWGGTFYAIAHSAPHKALAWQLIELLTLDKDQQLAAFRKQDAFPALLAAQDDPFFAEPITYLGGQRARLLWRDAARRIAPTRVNRLDPVADDVVNQALDEVLDQGRDIGAALAAARALIERHARRR